MDRRRVLLVDDDPAMRLLVGAALERLGRCDVWAAEAEECTPQAVVRFAPRLMVLDVRLGRRYDGFDLLGELRRQPELLAVPALFCTGVSAADLGSRLAGVDGVEYLRKPFLARDLAARVDRLLAGAVR